MSAARWLGRAVKAIGLLHRPTAVRLAHFGFAHPFKGRLIATRLPEWMQQAQGFRFASGQLSIQAYYWPAAGPTVLLAHGWESNSSRWEAWVDALQQAGLAVVCIDAPAHGLSNGALFAVPDYAQALQDVCKQFAPQYVVGHSMGAFAAFCALQQPLSIRKAVGLGAPAAMTDLLEAYVHTTGLGPDWQQKLQNYWASHFQIDASAFGPEFWLPHLQLPVLLGHDLDDQIVSRAAFERLCAARPSAQTLTTQGLGHSQQSPEVIRQVLAFIQD